MYCIAHSVENAFMLVQGTLCNWTLQWVQTADYLKLCCYREDRYFSAKESFLSGAYQWIQDLANQALACFIRAYVRLPGRKRNQSAAKTFLITINKQSLMVFPSFYL